MQWIKWVFILVYIAIVGSVVHYALPQRDIVRIVDVNTRRIDFDGNSFFWADRSSPEGQLLNRDVRFIEAVYPNGAVIVYRNEDTRFNWPPYLKFDSADLSAEARELVSTAEAPKWVALRHYGWRNTYLSIFPNAVSITPVDGPDVRLIPWLSSIILLIVGLFTLGLYRLIEGIARRIKALFT